MKILLFTDNYDERGGGAEKVFFKLIKELKQAKNKVYSFGFGPNSIKKRDHIIIKECKSLIGRHLGRLFFNPVKYFQIRKYIKKVNPDVIHLHNINKYTFSLLFALNGYKIVQTVHDYGLICPTLWNVHNDLSPCPTGLKLKCLFKHRRNYNLFVYLSMLWFFYWRNFFLKKIVNVFISPSITLKKYLNIQGFRNVVYIPNTINLNKKKPNFEKTNNNQILYIGQLEKNKGVSVLINELKYLVEKKAHIKLKIAGTGSEKKNLIEQVKKLNLEKHVDFLGWVDNTTQLIQESFLTIVPSIGMEQFGLVTAESMFYYRPVIGSNRGATPWLLGDNEFGLVFDPFKKKDLSNKIIKLLKNKALYKKYAMLGHDRIAEILKNKQNLNQILKVYGEIQ